MGEARHGGQRVSTSKTPRRASLVQPTPEAIGFRISGPHERAAFAFLEGNAMSESKVAEALRKRADALDEQILALDGIGKVEEKNFTEELERLPMLKWMRNEFHELANEIER